MKEKLGFQALRIARRVRRSVIPRREPRHSMESVLRAFLALATPPRAVLDVGAANGTPALYAAFPDADFLLIEPLEEFRHTLNQIAAEMRSARMVAVAAGNTSGTRTLHVHPDLVGSSFYLEPEDDESVNGVPRQVAVTTLDALATEHSLEPPFFLKIDTQGHEADVLAGAERVLAQTAGVVLELSLFDFFEGAPSFASVIRQMDESGFVMYDLCDLRYRLLDGALGQFDALFVPKDSPLRGSHRYASDEQRRKQTAVIRRALR
jgi:FkbM family methyltransferase